MNNQESKSDKLENTMLFNQGSKQSSRLPVALQSGYIELEERKLEDFLQQAYAYAKCIHFVNEENRVDGDWSDLLIHNDSILLALIAKETSLNRDAQLRKLLRGRYDQDFQLILEMVTLCVHLVAKLEQWFSKMQQMSTTAISLTSKKLYELIQLCKAEVVEVYAIHTYLRQNVKSTRKDSFVKRCEQIEQFFLSLGPVWGVPEDGVALQKGQYASTNQYRYRLESIFYKISNSLHRFSDFCQQQLLDSLHGKKQEPSSALLVAFLQLLQIVSKKSEGFTDKHRNFYYRDILKMTNREGASDEAILLIECHQKNDISIDADTVFVAAIPELKQEIEYVTKNKTPIVPAKIAALANCYLHIDPYNVPAYYLGLVNNIHAQYYDNYSFMTKDWKQRSSLNSKPLGDDKSLFGEHLLDGQRNVEQATDIGFMIASNTLLLHHGKREFCLKFEFEEVCDELAESFESDSEANAITAYRQHIFSAFKTYLFEDKHTSIQQLDSHRLKVRDKLLKKGLSVEGFDEETLNSLQALESVYQRNLKYLKRQMFFQGLNLSISTDSGWHTLEHYQYHFYRNKDQVFAELTFEMDDSLPAVIACNDEQHNISKADAALLQANPNMPIIKVLLSQDSEFYLYSLLQNLVLHKVDIYVEVKGLKDLLVYNDTGPIDISSPFQPFTAIPKTGNALVIGSEELSFKSVSDISLNIEWHQLPADIGGFNSYYRSYDLNINNKDFVVGTGILKNGYWHKQDENENFQPLFSLSKLNKLNAFSHIKISNPELFQPEQNKQEQKLNYHTNTKSGFFKLFLSGREIAFGHSVYPHLLSENMMVALKKKKSTRKLNEPFTPLIKRLSVDYKANSQINIDQLSKVDAAKRQHQVYTVNPFGVQSLTQRAREGHAFLLPQYANANSFYIGIDLLTDYHEELITLYFDLQESSVNMIRRTVPKLEWSWLAGGNYWNPVLPQNVLSDTTTGFLKSGIVTLSLPKEAFKLGDVVSRNNKSSPNIIDESKLWLRVTTRDNPAEFCLLNGLEINAIVVSCNDIDSNKPAIVPSTSISRSKQSIAGIKSIYQPRDSLLGREKDSDSIWLQRTAERLRHRQRLVTPWDFERTVLDKFPFIEQVKCFPAQQILKGEQKKSPGNILMVVIPSYQRFGLTDLTVPPALVSATELDTIKQHLMSLSACGSNIHVINPNYEYIQVRCSVLFSTRYEKKNPHHALNRDLIHYLSSWGEFGKDKQFEWEFYEDDISAFIRELDYVDFVTNLSLLKITKLTQDSYLRTDSVLQSQNEKLKKPLKPKFPWCIAIPARNHAIQVLGERQNIDAEVTGYDELEIGNSFILAE